MFATHATAQDVDHVRTALVLIAVVLVVFWRLAIRILLVIILVIIGAGAFVLLQGTRL